VAPTPVQFKAFLNDQIEMARQLTGRAAYTPPPKALPARPHTSHGISGPEAPGAQQRLSQSAGPGYTQLRAEESMDQPAKLIRPFSATVRLLTEAKTQRQESAQRAKQGSPPAKHRDSGVTNGVPDARLMWGATSKLTKSPKAQLRARRKMKQMESDDRRARRNERGGESQDSSYDLSPAQVIARAHLRANEDCFDNGHFRLDTSPRYQQNPYDPTPALRNIILPQDFVPDDAHSGVYGAVNLLVDDAALKRPSRQTPERKPLYNTPPRDKHWVAPPGSPQFVSPLEVLRNEFGVQGLRPPAPVVEQDSDEEPPPPPVKSKSNSRASSPGNRKSRPSSGKAPQPRSRSNSRDSRAQSQRSSHSDSRTASRSGSRAVSRDSSRASSPRSAHGLPSNLAQHL